MITSKLYMIEPYSEGGNIATYRSLHFTRHTFKIMISNANKKSTLLSIIKLTLEAIIKSKVTDNTVRNLSANIMGSEIKL
jgi:hypothetical protein